MTCLEPSGQYRNLWSCVENHHYLQSPFSELLLHPQTELFPEKYPEAFLKNGVELDFISHQKLQVSERTPSSQKNRLSFWSSRTWTTLEIQNLPLPSLSYFWSPETASVACKEAAPICPPIGKAFVEQTGWDLFAYFQCGDSKRTAGSCVQPAVQPHP